MAELKSENRKSSALREALNQIPPPDSSSAMLIGGYSALAGLYSLSGYYIMVGMADRFEELYPGRNYSFLVVAPQYIAIPICIMISTWIKRIGMRIKIAVFTLLSLLVFFVVPILPLIMPNSNVSFFGFLGVYLIYFMFTVLLEGNMVTSLALFDEKYTVSYFTFQPLFNIIFMGLKLGGFNLGFNLYHDFILSWTIFGIIGIGFFISFILITKRAEFKAIERTQSMQQQYNPEIWATIRELKWEVTGIATTLFFTFLIFPGIFFTLFPASLMSRTEYINIINFIAAFGDFLGRPFGNFRFNKVLIWVYESSHLMIVAFMLICYLADLVSIYEGLIYTFFVMAGFSIFRTSLHISYFMTEANKKARYEHAETVGVVMTNFLYVGMTLGNLVSISFPYLRNVLLG